MTLVEWLEADGRGAVSRLSRKSDISMLTIRRVRDGLKLRNVVVARKISDATGGAVSTESMIELDEPRSHSSPPPAA